MSDTPVIEFDPAPWVERAACAGLDPDLWFPGRGESTRDAKAICHRCPVRDECLEHALSVPERFGIWGGLSERERRRIRIDRRKTYLRVVS